MNRKLLLVIAVVMLVALVPLVAFAHDADDPFVTDLTADGGSMDTAVDVGDVHVWNDGTNLYVKYVVNGDLDPDNSAPTLIYQTHLDVVTDYNDFHMTKKGVPIPGQFTYSDTHDPMVAEFQYTIPLNNWTAGTKLHIAAHSVVKELGGVDGLVYTLPDTVTLVVALGDDSYFDAFITNGGDLDGTYDSWCVDIGHFIAPGATYNGVVPYSSYEALPDGTTIDKPENLPLVNYIINNYTAGDLSPGGLGNYTMCDIQKAIWALVDYSDYSCGGYSQDRVDEIVADAVANGGGFVPGCGDQVALVLVTPGSVQATIQVITIGVDVPCEDISETAWGGDYFGDPLEFGGRTWAIYFLYEVQ